MSTRTLETAFFDILYKPSRTHIPVGINPILNVRDLLPLLLAVDRVLFIPCLERTFLLVFDLGWHLMTLLMKVSLCSRT